MSMTTENRLNIVYRGEYEFDFDNLYSFMPPADRFRDLLDEPDRKRVVLIWLESLFFKRGFISGETLSRTKGYVWEESLYFFFCNGIPGYWLFDDRMDMVSYFAVDADHNDKKEFVAKALRNLIEADGPNVTLKDWENVRKAE